jgi:hypothetical protein
LEKPHSSRNKEAKTNTTTVGGRQIVERKKRDRDTEREKEREERGAGLRLRSSGAVSIAGSNISL